MLSIQFQSRLIPIEILPDFGGLRGRVNWITMYNFMKIFCFFKMWKKYKSKVQEWRWWVNCNILLLEEVFEYFLSKTGPGCHSIRYGAKESGQMSQQCLLVACNAIVVMTSKKCGQTIIHYFSKEKGVMTVVIFSCSKKHQTTIHYFFKRKGVMKVVVFLAQKIVKP